MDTQQSRVIQFETPQVMGGWNWNVDADRVVISSSLAPLFALDLEAEQRGISFDQFLSTVHQDDRERVRLSVLKAIDDGSIYDVVFRVVSSGLGSRWVRSKGQCYYDDKGELVQMTGFAVEAVPASSTLHAAIADRLIEARTLSVAAHERMLTKLIDAVILEAGLQLADAIKGLKDGRA